MQPRRQFQSLRQKNARMLQIALHPAAIALEMVIDGGRWFLIAAREIRRHPDLPAGALQKSRLYEIMAHDFAPEWRPAGKFRQSAMLLEGAHADDGIVAPVIALPALQPGQSGIVGGAIG